MKFGSHRGMRNRSTMRLSAPETLVNSRHSEMSVISSLDDQYPGANVFLIDLLAQSAQLASATDVSSIVDRCASVEEKTLMETWPGEHYKLLPALCQLLNVQTAIEVGTYRGQGTLALALGAQRVITYDIQTYSSFADSVLTASDFDLGIEQRIGDLSDPRYFATQERSLTDAQLIFVDGPKDGKFERAFAELLIPAIKGSGVILVWDDIRVLSMVEFWRWLPIPKLDATSIGHWSGTGLSQS